MLYLVTSLFSLLLGIGIFLVGIGLLGTLLGLRAAAEHFPDAITGIVMSAYFLGFAVGTYLCPALIRRVGHIRAFAAMAAVGSAAVIGHALLIAPLPWIGLRFVLGVCMVGIYMVVESWLNVLVPNQGRGQIFALYMAITLLAMALGQFLILTADIREFTLFAVASVCLSLALVPIVLTRVEQPPPVAAPALGLKRLYRQSPLGTFGALVSGLVSGGFWGMGPVFAYRLGLSERGIAAFMGAVILGGVLLQWPIGRVSDLRDRREVLTAACFGAAAAAFVALGVARHSEALLIATAFLYGGLVFSLYSLSVAHVNDFLTPAEILDATKGLLLLYGIGAAVGPAAGGWLMDLFGAKALLGFFGVSLTALGVFAVYRMGRREGVPVAEQAPFVPLVRTSQAALELDPRAEAEP